jgi:hypothetical protein
VEVPVFDALRTSKLVTRFFSKEMSLEEHRTHDEKKLTKDDLHVVRAVFPEIETRRYCLTSRLHRIVERRRPERASRLERIDHVMMRALPFLAPLGGEIVLLLRK